MNRLSFFTLCCAIALLTSDSYVAAQPPGDRGQGGRQSGPRGGGMRQPGGSQQSPPWLRIFDADHNGELSAAEIKMASQSLLKMDQNGDGRLTLDELGPPGGRPQGREGAGGQGQARGQGRPGGQSRPGPQDGAMNGGRPGTPNSPSGRSGGNRGGAGGRSGGGNPDETFAKDLLSFDENANKQIEKAELPEHMHAAFDVADANRNGSLDEAELLTLAAQFRRNRLNPDGSETPRVNQPTGGRPR